ncbi:MAG TPA: adenylate/guanylate cyclase domain-containing protein [Bellilinea sp.]|nr:adenylate/guanylate cyclase domain-containing protein [Bellilinea sp.]
MATAYEIRKKAEEYLEPGSYETTVLDYIPDVTDNNVTFGNKGVKLHASVLYLDMRGSTDVIKAHHKYTVAKIQKAYLYLATQIVANNAGHVRSFNGDGILAFFPRNYKETIRNAVKAAMQITWMLKSECASAFERYLSVDFGIGIDHGELFVTRVGIPRNPDHNDLTWIGLPVNTAVRLGDTAKNPNNICISSYMYENLLDEVKYVEITRPWGSIEQIDMWKQNFMTVHGEITSVYNTSYHWSF